MRDLVNDASNTVFVSAVSAYEIAFKHGRGKWPGGDHLLGALDALVEADFTGLPLTIEHARIAGQLTGAHGDPFDRMLAAQAKVEGLKIVSVDPKLDQFGVERLW